MRNGRVEVVSGVQASDRVVERGAGFLKDGDRIRVVEADEPGSDLCRAHAQREAGPT